MDDRSLSSLGEIEEFIARLRNHPKLPQDLPLTSTLIYHIVSNWTAHTDIAWMGAQWTEWMEIAGITPFQYARARMVLERKNLMKKQRTSQIGSSEPIVWHSVKMDCGRVREGMNTIRWASNQRP